MSSRAPFFRLSTLGETTMKILAPRHFFMPVKNSVTVGRMSLRFVKDETVSGTGLVTASTSEAAEAGLKMLRAVGNVFDAAINH